MKKLEALTYFDFEDGYNSVCRYLDDIDHIGKLEYGRYIESHVFDENKSVIWNREEVKRRNAERENNNALVRAVRKLSLDNLNKALEVDISKSYNISEDGARQILNFAKQLFEGCWWEYLDDIAEFYVNTKFKEVK